MHYIATIVNGALVKRILRDSGIPIKAELLCGISHRRFDKPALTGFVVHAAHITLLAHAIYPRGVFSIGHYVKAVATAYVIPVVVANATVGPGIGRTMPAAIVLHAAHYVIRNLIVHIDMI